MCSKEYSKDDAFKEENGILFWINKSGFPIDEMPWERMWDHVVKIHPEGHKMVDRIRNSKDLKSVPFPQVPTNFPPNTLIPDRVLAVQKYMKQLQYNHTGTQFFEIRKNRPISGLMDAAREMIKESLPIKCLEAVILGIFLTNGMPGLERFTISFKSAFSGNFHRHVVLGLFYNGKYGAIGMSRREELMFKPLTFQSLTDLIIDFQRCYNKYWHDLKKLKIGLPIPHDNHSYEQISWKYLSLSLPRLSLSELQKELEKHAREVRAQCRMREVPVYFSKTPKMKGSCSSSYSPSKLSMSVPSSPKKEVTFVPTYKDCSPSRRRSKSEVRSTPGTKAGIKDRKAADVGAYQIRI